MMANTESLLWQYEEAEKARGGGTTEQILTMNADENIGPTRRCFVV